VSSGKDTLNVFSDEDIKKSLESQSVRVFDTASIADDALINQPKPMISIMIGANSDSIPAAITDNSYSVIDQRNIQSGFNFAQAVINDQTSAVTERINAGNGFLIRYASPKRQGTHSSIVRSNSTQYNTSITSTMKFETQSNIPMPEEANKASFSDALTSVEITTANGAFLGSQILLANADSLHPITRWTNTQYAPADYSWTLNGASIPLETDNGVDTNVDTYVVTNDGSIANPVVGTYVVTNDASTESAIIDVINAYSSTLSITNVFNNVINSLTITASDYVNDAANPATETNITFSATSYGTPLETSDYTWTLSDGALIQKVDDVTPHDYEVIGGHIIFSEKTLVNIPALTDLVVTATNITHGGTNTFTITNN
jgi:hypothetical protein